MAIICFWSVELIADKKSLPATASVVVTVAGDKEAIKNANVLLTTKDDSYNESLYTDKHGKAQFSDVPVGAITLQVIATGWKTHGSVESIKAPSSRFAVTLERKPKSQPTGPDDR